ncbi:lysoplasmalogenase [Novosphingobium sp. PASSN1]|uniref:lysoplasmalogenase n=1 Tax=Novosphingobium sp. PASSN1 TaxID=2015561 RepID=UPI000BCD1B14|nr:lysoplasmalogenase [Novosphingobium sp. PASSN1]OYU37257.1 MAG: lysoplasmalogenase [Novosphingobium sp. PASSN1]
MPQRALIEQRPWLLASLIAGISYWFVAESWIPGLYLILWKGAGVGLLAVYAWRHHPVADAHRIALVMALGALGDMVLVVNFTGGALAFLLGHLAAIALYLRHRRAAMAAGERIATAVLLLAVPAASLALTGRPEVGLYALGLGGMTAAAFASNFPRSQVALGAVMFAVSDLLIFAQMGLLADSALPRLLIWPLYYFGQFLIAVGVIGALRRKGAFTAP